MGGNGGAIYNDGNEIVLDITSSLLEDNHANEGGSAVFFVSNNMMARSTSRIRSPATIQRVPSRRRICRAFT